MPRPGQISWRSVGLTARAVKMALFPNSRRKRQEGATQRVGNHSGEEAPSPQGKTLQQYRWEQHVNFIQAQEEKRGGPRRRNTSVHDTPKRRPNPPPAKPDRATLPPRTGKDSKCRERAQAAGSILLAGLQDISEEGTSQNPPLETGQWMSAWEN